MNFKTLAAGLLDQAITLAETYYPALVVVEPFVKGLAAGILHTEATPAANPDGTPMTPEEFETYRAAVMANIDELLGKVDGLLAMAAEERRKALADQATE